MLAKLFNLLPLRTVLIIPFVLQILALTSVVGWLSFRNGEHAVTEVAWQIPQEISARIAQHIKDHVQISHEVNQQFRQAVQAGFLNPHDSEQLKRYFNQQLQRYAAVQWLQLSNPTAAITIKAQRDPQQHVMGANLSDPINIVTYPQAQSAFAELALIRQSTWPSPQQAVDTLTIGLGLSPLSNFLHSLNLEADERAFIIEQNGLIIANATATANPLLTMTDGQWQGLDATISQDALLQASFAQLSQRITQLSASTPTQMGYFSYLKHRYLWHGRNFELELNANTRLRWLIVVIMPEQRFMQPILQNLQWHSLWSFAALLMAIAIGIGITCWIIAPIVHVNNAAQHLIAQLPRRSLPQNSPAPWLHALPEQRQDELGQLKRSFNQMVIQLKQSFDMLAVKNDELHQLDVLKDEFLANTSQELRSPLQGIIELANQSLPQQEQLQSLDQLEVYNNLSMIIASAKRLASLVDDILDFSKLRAHNLQIKPQAVNIQHAVATVLTLSQPLVQHKTLQLHNQISDRLPLVYADENRLQQVLFNLIGNAIKFTEHGSIMVTAQLYSALSLADTFSHVHITISDTGIGISEQKQSKIFQSFEQGEGSIGRQYGGTGLGLAITKQIVELQGGEVWVTSQLGHGSQFHFTLPIAQQSNSKASHLPPNVPLFIEAPRASHQESSYVATISRHRPTDAEITLSETNALSSSSWEHFNPTTFTLLVVDDEPVNLQVLTNYLALAGYELVQATSGQEAMRIIEQGLLPDAILLDVMMPQLNGYEVMQQLRAHYGLTTLPILLLTARTQTQDKVKGLTLGANDYLSKPLKREELLARLRTHLHLKHLQMKNMRMHTELQIAQTLQQLLLPTALELQSVAGLEIAALMLPAEDIGGDYYDVLQNGEHTLICMGDATGHGLHSGVIMLMAQAIIRGLFEWGELDLSQLLATLNTVLYQNIQFRMQTDKNLTLVLLLYQQGEICLSGQHEEIIVLRADGELEVIKTAQLGLLLGFMPDVAEHIQTLRIALQPGDIMVLFTDGITEAYDKTGHLYGLEQLCKVISCCRGLNVKEVLEAIMADIDAFTGEQPLTDDMSVLVLKRNSLD